MENIFFVNENLTERLKEFMFKNNLNQTELARVLGYKSSEKISRLFRIKGAMPSVDIVMDIANKFENLNLEWLVLGKGEMFKKETLKEKIEKQLHDNAIIINLLTSRVKQLEKQIMDLGHTPTPIS